MNDPKPTVSAVPRPALDLDHLDRQSCGDTDLQAELLDLFATQAKAILRDLTAGASPPAPQRSADLLHTLCGSARAVGAWEVAADAEQLEHAARRSNSPAGPDALAGLGRSVTLACGAIEAWQGLGAGEPAGLPQRESTLARSAKSV